MDWREAFLAQARSDHAFLMQLPPAAGTANRLHYLQMAPEKLAKGIMASLGEIDPPKPSHLALVRMLQTLKGQRDIQKLLGFSDAGFFRSHINAMLPMAEKLERLAPSFAGFSQPNPEYPWKDAATEAVIVPAEYPFSEFIDLRMIRLERLISNLVRIMR